ncbi:methyl-accepting chemotaxis protein [Haladaptatus litoreus]|uniref:Methyl-accepting chemotaxis protein n=1 Tax=Haladaptatus litoreus TaxID=553468 RepID=A0A1N6XS91_9EURY|nr:methyl-accepting chemotaxis protein [Haladaptatus litoreus]SIR05180.1 methyl-accepting chemotaxis protein [Haladaptatus litoreus]
MTDADDTDGSRRGIQSRIEGVLPARIRRSYAAKFGTVLFTILILISSIGFYIHFDTKQLVQEENRTEINNAAKGEAEALHKWVTKKRSTTRFLAESVSANQTNMERQALVERKLIDLPNDVRAIHYVDSQSKTVLASTTDELVGTTPTATDAAWANKSLSVSDSDGVQVMNPYEENGEPVTAFVAPTSDPNRMVVMTTSLTERSHALSSPIATGDMTVVDGEGTVVLDNQNARVLSGYGDDASAAIADGLSGNSDIKRMSGADGKSAVMAYTPVVGTDWVLLYQVPVESAFALQTHVTQNIGVLVAMAVLMLVVVGLSIGRGTAQSLATVSKTADEISAGRLDAELPRTRREDEMGNLFGSFESMHEYLNTVADQADALARKEFDAPVFEKEVPGEFGETLEEMRTDLRAMVADIERARAEAENAQAEAEASQARAESAQQEAEQLNTALQRKANEFSAVMGQAADGDLTQRMATESPTQPMTDIAREFNQMMDELEATIRDVNEFAETVAAASQEVTASTDEIEQASQQVTESTQLMSEGAVEQSERLEHTAGEMSELSATIEEIAASADQVAESANHAETLGEDGREAAQAAIEEMAAIESGTETTVEHIVELETEIERIGDVVELIRSIADQTNMLALNANIEAASADGSTEGFEVVANEVKELANETKEAVGDIEQRIETVRERAEVTVEDIRETHGAVEDGVVTVNEALESLEEIVENVEETSVGVEEINDVTDEQAETTADVVAMVDDVSQIGEQTAEEAEDVAAAAEEQTASLGEVSQSAESLARQAESLAATVDDFRVEPQNDESGSDDSQ